MIQADRKFMADMQAKPQPPSAPVPRADPAPEAPAPSAQMHERQTLQTELARVQEELDHLRSAMSAEVDIDPEEGDVEVSERLKNVTLIAMLEKREAALLEAIEALAAGHYGICNRCRQPIAKERLEARPDAKYCVRCQEEIERSAGRLA